VTLDAKFPSVSLILFVPGSYASVISCELSILFVIPSEIIEPNIETELINEPEALFMLVRASNSKSDIDGMEFTSNIRLYESVIWSPHELVITAGPGVIRSKILSSSYTYEIGNIFA
jgi:hypothetical protein